MQETLMARRRLLKGFAATGLASLGSSALEHCP